ncbi:hypothetical protein [Hymenobacter sp.]|uniref:hypothetical protein n=1 Tax=Hymenobacter sp. TaxID=1898978 RepID=UPI00286A7FD3|nr:hypothetical protein [Hymenobacter sp.]
MSIFPFNTSSAAVRRLTPVALLGLALLSSCSDDDDSPAAPAAPAVVIFTQAGLYPEGVQYDAPNSRFLVTSLTTGQVGQVDDDGTYSPAFTNTTGLVSAIGLYLDNAQGRNRVLVAVSDPGANQQRTSMTTLNKLARLAIYNNANASAAPTIVELGTLRPNANHFANDVAVDNSGNAYVTDSFSGIIYKVDATTNAASVFVESPQFAAPAGAFGLNGIVFHPDGYLLAVKSDEGKLFKIPLAAPATFTTVATTQNLTAADGLLLQDNNTLQVVSNAQARVFRLATTNAFGAATLAGSFTTAAQFPTTLARRDGASYVLYANLDVLFGMRMPAPTQPISEYSINRVSFQ